MWHTLACISSVSRPPRVVWFHYLHSSERKQRHREVKWFASGHTANKGCCHCSVPVPPSPALCHLQYSICCALILYTHYFIPSFQSSDIGDMISVWLRKKLKLREEWQCLCPDSEQPGPKAGALPHSMLSVSLRSLPWWVLGVLRDRLTIPSLQQPVYFIRMPWKILFEERV